MIEAGHEVAARKFFEKHKGKFSELYPEELVKIDNIRTIDQLREDEYFSSLRSNFLITTSIFLFFY